ncbi:5868_t:CDS:2 [Gigaspora margarita]|uniref:5868_t:CDS:1 n=1 Tax=Gigaspora margarita TaxID=4874 RepID=A0ABN7VNI4_GIGMA|nr:5868_t:CDS:2 [Gigaspora margarita]
MLNTLVIQIIPLMIIPDDASNKNIPLKSNHEFLNKTVSYRNANRLPVKVDLEYPNRFNCENGPSITFNQVSTIMSDWSKIIKPSKLNLGVDFYGIIELTTPINMGSLDNSQIAPLTGSPTPLYEYYYISYEDPQSIQYKLKLIINSSYGGITISDLYADSSNREINGVSSPSIYTTIMAILIILCCCGICYCKKFKPSITLISTTSKNRGTHRTHRAPRQPVGIVWAEV